MRNGKVRYKELALSGLVSYQMDQNELFISNAEIGIINKHYSTDLTS
jgi:hypothetical protein